MKLLLSGDEVQHCERGLLGAMMNDPDCIDQVQGELVGEYFQMPEHGAVFDALCTLHNAGVNLKDMRTLAMHLQKMRLRLGNLSYRDLCDMYLGGFSHNRNYYAEVICAAWRKRRLGIIGAELLRRSEVSVEERPVDDAAWIESELAMLNQTGSRELRSAVEIADEVIAEIQKPRTGDPVMTGVLSIDEHLGPMMPGELIVIAARPGCGKTSLAMQVAQHAATNGATLVVSLEMRDRELITRAMAAIGGVDNRDIREGNVAPAMIESLGVARNTLVGLPLYVWAPPRATVSQITAKAKYTKAVHGLKLVVVDYIGLVDVSGDDRRLERHLQVGKVTGSLKALAKECDCPVIALAQLNREADGQAPKLSNLRESGSIEQDADIVMFIHHPERSKRGESTRAEIITAKHRHGQVGVSLVQWNPSCTRFEALEWNG